jgi:predicted pyridoxine 5'-phosphate oxidase superfamily flavin-nucleotide-binding protein
VGKVHDAIDETQRKWIAKQALFFVGTAPLDDEGHVNVSPKGPVGTLRVLDERTVA